MQTMQTEMDEIDVNYILDGQVQLFDYMFFTKVGIDGDKNYVYQVQDKFRDYRYAKFIVVPDPSKIKQTISQLLIYQNSNQSKLIQPIYDFTVHRDKKIILVTMPVPPRTLYSVIKDTKVNLRVRLFLVQNLANGGVYMHNRRRFIFGHIRPQSIVIHQQLNVFDRGKNIKKFNSPFDVQLYARLNSFSTMTETPSKPQSWKWMNTQLQYYDAPEIWSEIDKKKKIDTSLISAQSQKSIDNSKQMRYTEKSDIWAFGLVMVQILSAMRITQLLGGDIVPGRYLKEIIVRQKILKQRAKLNQNLNANDHYQKNQFGSFMTSEQFYDRLFRYIQCFPLKSILQRMLNVKPEKRPTIQEVLIFVQKLEVLDKRNKNMGRISTYRRSLRSLKQTVQQKEKAQQKNEDEDDKKSVVSMKSVRSGKSNKSYVSQSRKRIPPQFSSLLYARQQITEIHTIPTNPMYRTYFQDCKNRLPIDINFTPPPKKFLMRKDDKAIVLSIKGEKDQDIKSWNVEKAIGNYLHNIQQKILGGGQKYFPMQLQKGKSSKKYDIILHNLRVEQEKKIQDQNTKNPKIANFGPAVKKIPHNTTNMKDYGYNDNLVNYHFLGVQYTKQTQNLHTTFFRRQVQHYNVDQPQKLPQFILNLRSRGLIVIPASIGQFLNYPNCLKYLCLARNRISSLQPLKINQKICDSLMVLDISHNILSRIDIELWRLEELQQCYFGYNQISVIEGFQEFFPLTDDEKHTQPEANIQSDEKFESSRGCNEGEILYKNSDDGSISDQIVDNLNEQSHNKNNELQESEIIQHNTSEIRVEKVAKQNGKDKQEHKKQDREERGVRKCKKLRRLYLNSNKIRQIENLLNLTNLQVLAIGRNPLSENQQNIIALEKLREKEVKIYY